MIYQSPPATDGLTQGDILDGCPIFRHKPDGLAEQILARVVVLTQACDLDQRKAKRVAVAAVVPAALYVQAGEVKGATVRDQVRFGKVFGLYFLPEAPPPVWVPESVIDLRDLHTVPRELLDGLTAAGKRVCRIPSPYREHLAQHFGMTYMRVALPEPYETRP